MEVLAPAGATVRSAPVQPQPQPQPQPQQYQQPQQAWQSATTPELGGPARRIKNDRSLLVLILLAMVTFGIYSFYFIYSMAQDMNTMCEDDDQNTGGLIFFIILNFLTFGIYGLYWWYKIANRVQMNAPRYGFAVAENGGTYLLWQLLGLISFGICSLIGTHTVIKNVNNLANGYNRAHGYI